MRGKNPTQPLLLSLSIDSAILHFNWGMHEPVRVLSYSEFLLITLPFPQEHSYISGSMRALLWIVTFFHLIERMK